MIFEFDIEDCGITIINVIDKNVNDLIIPEKIGGLFVKKLTRGMLHNCEELRSIHIPNSVENIHYALLLGNFKYLTEINLKPIGNKFILLNNKFIVYGKLVYSIKYEICGNYVLSCDETTVLLIDNMFKINFNEW